MVAFFAGFLFQLRSTQLPLKRGILVVLLCGVFPLTLLGVQRMTHSALLSHHPEQTFLKASSVRSFLLTPRDHFRRSKRIHSPKDHERHGEKVERGRLMSAGDDGESFLDRFRRFIVFLIELLT